MDQISELNKDIDRLCSRIDEKDIKIGEQRSRIAQLEKYIDRLEGN